MSVAVHVSADGIRTPLSRARVSDIARRVLASEGVNEAMISITFLRARAIGTLNRKHLGHRGPTDVIAFGFSEAGRQAPVIGDIYIAPEVARESARRHRVGVREEVARLVVHGVLHVLGYEHADDESRVTSPMWRRQERLLASVFEEAPA